MSPVPYLALVTESPSNGGPLFPHPWGLMLRSEGAWTSGESPRQLDGLAFQPGGQRQGRRSLLPELVTNTPP